MINLYEPANDWKRLKTACSSHGYVPRESLPLDNLDTTLKDISAEYDEIFTINRMRRDLRGPVQVMLVEDDPFARKIVSKCLRKNQQLITTGTAQDAVTQYMLNAPDIVFLDIGLPDHDGFSVINAIKAHDPDAFIVMFSGNNFSDHITRSLSNGAKGFIGKPFRKEQLFHYIDECKQRRLN